SFQTTVISRSAGGTLIRNTHHFCAIGRVACASTDALSVQGCCSCQFKPSSPPSCTPHGRAPTSTAGRTSALPHPLRQAFVDTGVPEQIEVAAFPNHMTATLGQREGASR